MLFSLYLRISHRPFKAGYKPQLYSLHQKGTSLSDKAVAPSQYDLSCWWDVLTQAQQHIKRVFINTPLPEYFDPVLLFIVIAFCFSFLCSFLKRKVVPSGSDLITYWYRGRVHGGVEGQRTRINIFSLFFVSHMSL